MRVRCDACEGVGWVRAGEWGRFCRVCRGAGRISEYRIAQIIASLPSWVDGGHAVARSVMPASWTRRALRDLRRGRGLGRRRAMRLVEVLADASEVVP